MDHKIVQSPLSVLKVKMKKGERLYADSSMVHDRKPGLRIRKKIKGRVLRGLKRKILTGESLFLCEYHATRNDAELSLGASRHGAIVPVYLHDQAILCQRRSFVCFFGDMDLDIVFAFTQGTRQFDGKYFVLQKISGSGIAFIYSDSYIVERPEAAEKMLRQSGVLFSGIGEPAGNTSKTAYDMDSL